MRRGIVSAMLILLLMLSFSAMSVRVGRKWDERSDEMLTKRWVLQVTGPLSLALSGECTASRFLTEGLAGCLGDNPAGYCWHPSCDVVGCSDPSVDEEPFSLEVKK